MLISTTAGIAGHTIIEHKGLVLSQVTAGRHVGKDVLAGMRDVFGGRSKSLEKDLEASRRAALSELASEAGKIGANAVVGMRLDMENVSGSMLLFVGQGTAVVVARD